MSTTIENKSDINQTLITQAQQMLLQEIFQKTFITKKSTQCKTSYTLRIDVFELLDKKYYWKISFQSMKRFTWIKLILVLIHLLIKKLGL